MKEYQTPEFEITKYLSEDIFLSGEGENSTVNTDPDGYEQNMYQP